VTGDQVDVGQLAAAVARHLEMYQLRPATWRPQPHQVPPPGSWYGWLLNAGRGAGKTAAAARYVSAHVHGPPCLPGPVPHWVGIIAPTLGDGVTACFQGPSGLGSFDENARLLQTTGGTVVRWQNGSQAKMFGAHSQEDVERLRAGGNTSLAAGTLVRTKTGEVPIEDVRMGDQVWTRNGLRTVRRAGQTGVKPTWRLTTRAGRELELTGDHEVLVSGRWVAAELLRPGDSLTELDEVASCVNEDRVQPVYDLSVEYDHEFFANGILVSNCLIWAEELAAWRYLDASWQQMRFGLRSGPRPHWVASTTPKPRALIKKLIKQTPHNVVVTHATTDDNPHLEAHVRAALDEEYGGLQIGQQELYAEILEQDVHALWQRDDLNEYRLKESPPLVRITVGVDPSGGAGEQGIIVAGKAFEDSIANGKAQRLAHGYVLADQTCSLSPDGWGRRAVQAAVDWEADDIVVEINFGGDMAISTIAGAAEVMGISIPIRETRASRGKRVRAEPVSVLSARGRWHHVGRYEQLEDQLCTWVPDQADYSPDRLDAMVWTGWHQRLVGTSLRAPGNFGGLAVVRSVIS
jgi:phage terminase large subunit-like protein